MEKTLQSDLELLQRFAKQGDEQAFEILVARYANLVFGVALRRGVDRHGAEDVTQKVFAVLARKAGKLKRKASLAGWLSRTATLEAAYARRSESNQKRKMKNYQQSGIAPDAETDWSPADGDVAVWRAALPHLDEVLGDLPAGDQEVVLQRFYNGQSFAAIAALTSKSEAAVQKQSRRALDKMSRLLKRRGVAVPAVAIAGLLGSELAKAAPTTTFAALSQGAITVAPGITGVAILTNTLETMAYAKTKIVLVAAAVAAIPTGLQWGRINELKTELEERPVAVAPVVSESGEVKQLRKQISELKSQLAVATESGRSAKVTALTGKGGSKGGEDVEKQGGGNMSGFAEMFEDPAMREMMKTQMKGQIGMIYGDFLEGVDFDAQKMGKLEDLFVDRQMDLAANGIRAMGPADKEGREEMVATQESYNEQLREMLGEEKFEELQLFEDSTPERTELKSFKDSLVRGGLPELSYEQEEQLMGIMYEERKAFKFSGGYTPNQNEVPDWKPSKEMTTQVTADYANLQAQIGVRVGEVLKPEQIEVFNKNQESFLKMTEAGLKMSEQMFGAGGGE